MKAHLLVSIKISFLSVISAKILKNMYQKATALSNKEKNRRYMEHLNDPAYALTLPLLLARVCRRTKRCRYSVNHTSILKVIINSRFVALP